MGVIAEMGELPDGTPGVARFPLPNLELSDFPKGIVTYDMRQFGPIFVEDFEKHRSQIEELWGCPVIIEVPKIGGMLLEGTVRIRQSRRICLNHAPIRKNLILFGLADQKILLASGVRSMSNRRVGSVRRSLHNKKSLRSRR